jgi:UDP-2,3-diacylglucosamine pyrophosphatase LpxH
MLKFTKMNKISRILRAAIFPLGILVIIFIFGFVSWIFNGHGTTGLFRLTPISLYVFLVLILSGIVFAALFFRYWWLSLKGQTKNKLFGFLIISSVILIAFFAFCFIETGVLPPSKNIKPVTQLAIADIPKPDIHFAVGSDAHFGAGTNSPDKSADMLKQIGDPANKYDMFFFLGDLVNYGFRDGQWQEALKAFSTTANSIPVRFVPGNHDTLFGGLKRYLAYCGPTTTTQDASKLWQRIDVGNVHFLLLDVEWSAETFTKEQADWLEAQLKSIPDKDWKIVMSHGFYYSSGVTQFGWNWYDNPETIKALTPLFEKYHVDIVFSGHNHYMEFLQHSSVSYVICGAFGGQPDPTPTYKSPASLWQLTGGAGFVDVTLHDNEATLIFRDYNSNVLQTFTVTKK